jgi:hypothetical protein
MISAGLSHGNEHENREHDSKGAEDSEAHGRTPMNSLEYNISVIGAPR